MNKNIDSILPLVLLPDKRLHQKSKIVDNFDDIPDLYIKMQQCMLHHNGVGLAGVQVGILQNIFIVHYNTNIHIFVNPIITAYSHEHSDYNEGCLSIPGITENITRPNAVNITAYNEYGKEFSTEADGLFARIIQHEYDHLNGILFYEHLEEHKKNILLKQYNTKK